MSGFDGERVSTRPSSPDRAFTSVTEMIAKRGSTASSNVSATLGGGAFEVALAAGTVFTR